MLDSCAGTTLNMYAVLFLTYLGIQMQADPSTRRFLLAIPVGIKQKDNVNRIVQKVLHTVLSNVFVSSTEHFLPNIIEFSFFQRILQLFYFIMMAKWMGGGI